MWPFPRHDPSKSLTGVASPPFPSSLRISLHTQAILVREKKSISQKVTRRRVQGLVRWAHKREGDDLIYFHKLEGTKKCGPHGRWSWSHLFSSLGQWHFGRFYPFRDEITWLQANFMKNIMLCTDKYNFLISMWQVLFVVPGSNFFQNICSQQGKVETSFNNKAHVLFSNQSTFLYNFWIAWW